jgi:hypothetical protein
MTITELLAQIQELTGTQNTTTSSYTTVSKTRDINSALNKFMLLAIESEGKWQVDDTNQTDYPIIFGDIVSGQQDYSFLTDETGNQILDIYKVRIKDSASNWTTLRQVDLQTGSDDDLNSTVQSIPSKYRLSANGIFLIDIPNYTLADALEVFINRTPYYFTSSDVSTGTKKAGIPWTFHEYLAIRPAYYYCLQKGLKQTEGLLGEMVRMEDMIGSYYSKRNKDQNTQIKTTYRSSR